MKIIVVVEDVMIQTYDKWSAVKKVHPDLKKDEFTKHGEDWICAMDLDSYRISRDIKALEDIATDKIFGKQKADYLTACVTAVITALAVVMFGG